MSVVNNRNLLWYVVDDEGFILRVCNTESDAISLKVVYEQRHSENS